MNVLNKEAIIKAKDIKTIAINVPEWGGEVYIKVMSGKKRDEWESFVVSKKDASGKIDLMGMRAKLLVCCLCDEQGNELFTDADIEILENKNADVLQRLFDAAARLNGLNSTSVEEIKADFTKSQSCASGIN